MKKIFCIIFFMLLFFHSPSPIFAFEDGYYRVLKILDGDTIYLDFNKDGKLQQNERVRINGIDAFETMPVKKLFYQRILLNISENQALFLGNLAKNFACNNLLNKIVLAKYTSENKFDKYNRHLMSIYYDNGKSYEVEILKAGLALVFGPSNLSPFLKDYENRHKIIENAKKCP